MAEIGLILLGFMVGFIVACIALVSMDKAAVKNGIWKCDGKVYKLIEIKP